MSIARYVKFQAIADAQIERALDAIRDDAATVDEVFSALGLAALAFQIALGEVAEDEWPDDSGPSCICPPDLRARGGHRGNCPAEHPWVPS